MIIDDRPNRLQYLTITPGYEDGNGDYHQGESKWEGDIPCRNVPVGKPNKDSLKTVSFAPIPLLSVWTLIAGSFPLEKK